MGHVGRKCLKDPEAVDDDDSRANLLEVAVDDREDVVESVLAQDWSDVFVDDAAVADGGRIKEFETLPIPEDLVERLRER